MTKLKNLQRLCKKIMFSQHVFNTMDGLTFKYPFAKKTVKVGFRLRLASYRAVEYNGADFWIWSFGFLSTGLIGNHGGHRLITNMLDSFKVQRSIIKRYYRPGMQYDADSTEYIVAQGNNPYRAVESSSKHISPWSCSFR